MLVNVWTDEYLQFTFRKKQYRYVVMRVVNNVTSRTRYAIGIFPAGTNIAMHARLSIPAVSLYEIYMKVIVPDLYQLENGISIGGKKYIGSLHLAVGDNAELTLLGGLSGMARS